MRQLIQKRKGPNGKITTYVINVPSYDDVVVVSTGADDGDDTDGGGSGDTGGGVAGIWIIGSSSIGNDNIIG